MLINCVAYRDGLKLAEITIDEISDYLEKDDVFVWVALKDPSDKELSDMQREFNLHDLAIEDVRHSNQRPKKEEYGDILFSVATLITRLPDKELQIGEIDIFTGKKFILSVRKNSPQDFLGVRGRCEREPHLLKLGSRYVLYALIDFVVDHYFDVLSDMEIDLDKLESDVFTKTKTLGRTNVETLYYLKRQVSILKHACVPLLEKFANFSGGRLPPVLDGGELNEYFRDLQDHLKRVVDRIDTLESAISQLIQVNLSLVTIDETEITKRLAAWAGIFGLATSFAGIWGMNFEGMAELQWKYGYELALVIIFGGCGLLYWRFKKIKWL
jgi:magnesium transporter